MVVYAAYCVDGRSRPAYEPAMMVALLLYAYARGIRSSRMIERVRRGRRLPRCSVRARAWRWWASSRSTKLQADASGDANVDYEQLAREIIEEAKAIDAAEDEL